MILTILLFTGIAFSGVLLVGMTALFHSPFGQARRIRVGRHGTTSQKDYKQNMALTSALSLGSVALLAALSWSWLFADGAVAWWRVPVEALVVLLLYDFMYYFMHRFPFHEWKRFKKIHAVHHRIRNPSAIDSLYLHPVENLAGLVLLWVATALVGLVAGPVHVLSFGIAFVVYTTMNVLVHAGLEWKVFPLTVLGGIARRHDKHHANMAAGNYANLFPFWDRMFGTEVK